MDKNIFLCAKRKTGRFLLISSLLIVLCISAAGFAGCGHTHTVIIDAAVAPTKTATGLTEGSHCEECGKILQEQQEVPATGSVGLIYGSNFDGKTCTVIGIGTCTDTEIIIPETSPTGYTVTAIQHSAFKDCVGIDSLSIPDSVTEIGSYAFENCKGLTNVTIGNGARRLGYGAFKGCVALVDISIGNAVTSIEDDAFKNCDSLKYNEYDNALYLGNNANKFVVLMCAKPSNIVSCEINNNCKVIYEEAFYECFSLKEIIIGCNVRSIGHSAFERCYRLTNLIIPDNVTSIGSSAFSGCLGLTNLIIPDSVTSIGSGAFAGCHGLTKVKLGANVIAIENAAFFDCSEIESINIPDSVTEIGQSAFAKCDKLKFNEYDNGLYLGNEKNKYMFFISPKSNDITSCEISKECKFVSNYAFYDCQGLTSVVIPDSVTSIGDCAFGYCENLTRVKIGKGVESIGAYAFSHCSGLQEILYDGTQGQWRVVKKKMDWNKDTGKYTVYCIYG